MQKAGCLAQPAFLYAADQVLAEQEQGQQNHDDDERLGDEPPVTRGGAEYIANEAEDDQQEGQHSCHVSQCVEVAGAVRIDRRCVIAIDEAEDEDDGAENGKQHLVGCANHALIARRIAEENDQQQNDEDNAGDRDQQGGCVADDMHL